MRGSGVILTSSFRIVLRLYLAGAIGVIAMVGAVRAEEGAGGKKEPSPLAKILADVSSPAGTAPERRSMALALGQVAGVLEREIRAATTTLQQQRALARQGPTHRQALSADGVAARLERKEEILNQFESRLEDNHRELDRLRAARAKCGNTEQEYDSRNRPIAASSCAATLRRGMKAAEDLRSAQAALPVRLQAIDRQTERAMSDDEEEEDGAGQPAGTDPWGDRNQWW